MLLPVGLARNPVFRTPGLPATRVVNALKRYVLSTRRADAGRLSVTRLASICSSTRLPNPKDAGRVCAMF